MALIQQGKAERATGLCRLRCSYAQDSFLYKTFQLEKLAHGVRETTLHSLITELLLWLLDERVPLMDDGSQLLKELNVLMLKILENADRTSALVILIRLLRSLQSSRWPTVSAEETSEVLRPCSEVPHLVDRSLAPVRSGSAATKHP